MGANVHCWQIENAIHDIKLQTVLMRQKIVLVIDLSPLLSKTQSLSTNLLAAQLYNFPAFCNLNCPSHCQHRHHQTDRLLSCLQAANVKFSKI